MLNSTNIVRFPAYLLFFLMLFVPTTYQPIKGAIIVVVLAGILLDVFLSKRFAVHKSILAITVVMSLTGLIFVNIGMVHRNPGALRVLPLYVFWPLLYLLFVAACARFEVLKELMKVMVIGGIAVSLYALLYILHEGKLIPGFLYYELDQARISGSTRDTSSSRSIRFRHCCFSSRSFWPRSCYGRKS